MISRPIPRIRPANSSPSPSRKKLAFRPRAGNHSIRVWITPPASTVGALSPRSTKASKVTEPVTAAQASRPARIIRPGKSAPRNGRAAIRARDIRAVSSSWRLVFCGLVRRGGFGAMWGSGQGIQGLSRPISCAFPARGAVLGASSPCGRRWRIPICAGGMAAPSRSAPRGSIWKRATQACARPARRDFRLGMGSRAGRGDLLLAVIGTPPCTA